MTELDRLELNDPAYNGTGWFGERCPGVCEGCGVRLPVRLEWDHEPGCPVAWPPERKARE